MMKKSELLGDHESLYLAKMLIEEHGERAACHARSNADRLMRVEDVEGGESWIRIAKAVELSYFRVTTITASGVRKLLTIMRSLGRTSLLCLLNRM